MIRFYNYIKKNNRWMVVLFLFIIVLGLIGCYLMGYGPYKSILRSLELFKVYLEPVDSPNIVFEAARLLGVIFFFSLIFTVFDTVFRSFVVAIRSLKRNTIAVHGDSVYAVTLYESLGKRAVMSNNSVVFRAPKQVIAFDNDADSIEFYQRHYNDLSEASEVHLCLKDYDHVSIEKDNVYVCNLSEIRAMDYWQGNFIMEAKDIVIIGSGSLAEAVLKWGLLTNVFDIENNINYHIIGDFEKYRALHSGFEEKMKIFGNDEISFAEGEWYQNLDLIRSADRVILCGDTQDNVKIAAELTDAGIGNEIHLFSESSAPGAILPEGVKICGAIEKSNIEAAILDDSLHRGGKLQHAAYLLENEKDEHFKSDIVNAADAVKTENFEADWKKQNAFTRKSNYASAVHDPIKRKLLEKEGIYVEELTNTQNKERYAELPESTRDRLQEIEHIRWSRYHILDNWEAAEGELMVNGKSTNKDPERRLHKDLIPYSYLSPGEQKKDSSSYETLGLRVEKSEKK